MNLRVLTTILVGVVRTLTPTTSLKKWLHRWESGYIHITFVKTTNVIIVMLSIFINVSSGSTLQLTGDRSSIPHIRASIPPAQNTTQHTVHNTAHRHYPRCINTSLITGTRYSPLYHITRARHTHIPLNITSREMDFIPSVITRRERVKTLLSTQHLTAFIYCSIVL